MKHLDTNLDTSEKSLDTFWILLGALSDTWPPLHVATESICHVTSSEKQSKVRDAVKHNVCKGKKKK